jgi:hypothetical protein
VATASPMVQNNVTTACSVAPTELALPNASWRHVVAMASYKDRPKNVTLVQAMGVKEFAAVLVGRWCYYPNREMDHRD